MINPLRSEEDAFRFTLIVVVLAAPIILTALVFSSAVALGVAGGIALGLLIGRFVSKQDEPREELLLGQPRSGGDVIERQHDHAGTSESR